MIEINLLPLARRKKSKKIEIPKIEFMPIIVGVIVLILFVQTVLAVTLAIKRHSLKTLEAKWAVIEPKKKEISNLKIQVNKLNNKITNIENLKTSRVPWAKKLNDISDSMVPGVWLTTLSVEEKMDKKYLSIIGSVSSFGKDETAVIGRFMKALKDNKGFFKDFNEIELGTIQQKNVRGTEIMDFSISCYFKEQ